MARILLVEDDPSLGHVVEDNLAVAGHDVLRAMDGAKGWQQFQCNSFDVCLLDVMMPNEDGFSLAKRIREVNRDIPILFISAKSMAEDRLAGFEVGADDYITKPFNMKELLYRIEVFMRRTTATTSTEHYQIGDAKFDISNSELHVLEETHRLTSKEAAVLHCLCKHMNEVVKREEILKQVWGDDDYFLGRSMDVFISRLRKYFKPLENVAIENHHGVGFRLSSQ